jgi:ABC-2 type transport system ATP-binding protein
MTQPAIQVRDLCKQYGPVLAVDHVSFAVQPGELVGFLGQNGAGKSTTMRILTTFQPASSGYAAVAGFDVLYQSRQVRENLGYLPESVPLYPEMRVEEYLQYRAKLKRVDRTARSRRVEYCLERCRIREVRRRLLSTLSKGYRQRVGLADALLSEPKVLILDEPLTGLDPVQQEETLAAVRQLGGKHTVLFSSHHLPDVEKVCDRVIIIDRGRLRFDDKLSALTDADPTLVVEVRGPQEQVAGFLKDQPGVTAVKKLTEADGVAGYELTAAHAADLREPLTKRLVEHGWGVRKLELKRPRLEDTFLKVVFQRG